jgi:hypothetical protein
MKILGVRWFTTGSSFIGIVQVESEYDGVKYYIKHIHPHSTEERDAQIIADWGATFPKEVGDLLFEKY